MNKILFLAFALFLMGKISAQSKSDFEQRMNNYVVQFLSDSENMKAVKEWTSHSCDIDHIVTPDEIIQIAENQAKEKFININMKEYLDLYFENQQYSPQSTTVTICDNGGFEDDFLNYIGFKSTFNNGSTTCNPYYDLLPSVFIPITLPATREVEIVTNGLDAITGIQKVKFGTKALKLNDPRSASNTCYGQLGINRIEKEFLVTTETRKFTVWYSVVLENPANYINTQPFFSITCDLAPQYDLCFDADLIQCDSSYYKPGCEYRRMDVLDWACHTIIIPEEYIGEIATLQITAADCGQSQHSGYAYIDGICEECTGSSLGSILLSDEISEDHEIGISYLSCDGTTAQICGKFIKPTICGEWKLTDLVVPGYDIVNFYINYINNTFCFDFPISDFEDDDCIDIFVEGVFKSGNLNTPLIVSNSINICKDKYYAYLESSVEIGDCKDNGTADLLSDDYYYVTVDITSPTSDNWTMTRKLENPYPGESGEYELKTGTGNGNIKLGPFLIQEGCWYLLITIENCSYVYTICPPPFCSGCSDFNGLKITNVKCIPKTGNTPNDTWSFDIFVPGSSFFTIGSTPLSQGVVHTIDMGPITGSCKNIELKYGLCIKTIIVCPPLPCSEQNCKIEAYIKDYICLENSFKVNLYIKNPNSLSLYYKINNGSGMPLPLSGILGPFSGDVEIVIYDNMNPNCFKVIYIPKLSCEDDESSTPEGRIIKEDTDGSIVLFPNPLLSDELIIQSDMINTEFEIYNTSYQLIYQDKFKGHEHKIRFTSPPGLFLIRYKDNNGHYRYCKLIKI